MCKICSTVLLGSVVDEQKLKLKRKQFVKPGHKNHVLGPIRFENIFVYLVKLGQKTLLDLDFEGHAPGPGRLGPPNFIQRENLSSGLKV